MLPRHPEIVARVFPEVAPFTAIGALPRVIETKGGPIARDPSKRAAKAQRGRERIIGAQAPGRDRDPTTPRLSRSRPPAQQQDAKRDGDECPHRHHTWRPAVVRWDGC